MRTSVALITATTVAAGALALAAPASAYDRDAYGYAAAHMIESSDVPRALGTMKRTLDFNAYANIGANFLCDVPQSDAQAPDRLVKFPASRYSFSGSYGGRGSDAPSIEVTVLQYDSSTAAIRAFDSLRKDIRSCTGTGSNTWTGEDGTTTTYSTEVFNGVVPLVTVTGVESVFVNSNSLSVSTPGDSRDVNDQYSVVTLVDDVIIQTQFYANSNNLTTRQRKAVNQVAFNAVTRWVD